MFSIKDLEWFFLSSMKHDVVALSSLEAEYVAGTLVACQALL